MNNGRRSLVPRLFRNIFNILKLAISELCDDRVQNSIGYIMVLFVRSRPVGESLDSVNIIITKPVYPDT